MISGYGFILAYFLKKYQKMHRLCGKMIFIGKEAKDNTFNTENCCGNYKRRIKDNKRTM